MLSSRKIRAAHIVQAKARRHFGAGEIGSDELGRLIRQGFHSGRSDERLEDRLREIGVREIRRMIQARLSLARRNLAPVSFVATSLAPRRSASDRSRPR